MGEGYNPSTGFAWGCTNPVGWVPYPKIIPRRHPLLDAAGRIDDPCARPAHNPPDYGPTPKFKPPREGYPNALCDPGDQTLQLHESSGPCDTSPYATINVAQNTPAGISMRLQPIWQSGNAMAQPGIEDCCSDARDLGTLKDEVDKITGDGCVGSGGKPRDMVLGPHETLEAGLKNWSKCTSPCGPNLPAYPCRGVIKPPRPEWLRLNAEEKCKPSMVSARGNTSEDDGKPITGREFVEGKRTCDLYPIDPNLPDRFNNSEWFKGYGCERPGHPFYLTTAMDYGRLPPTAHTMTQAYYPKDAKFTEILAKAGMPRNRSLNIRCQEDKSIV